MIWSQLKKIEQTDKNGVGAGRGIYEATIIRKA